MLSIFKKGATNTGVNNRIQLCLVLMAAVLLSGCGGNDEVQIDPPPKPIDYSKRKTLLIGVDGMQYEKLQEAIAAGQAPNLAKLSITKSYTGGVADSVTEQGTLSGPGWTTILTGAWVNRHKITGNDGKLHNQADSVFKLIKNADTSRRTASIVSWNTINDNFVDDIALGYIDRAEKCDDIDQCVADKVSGALRFGDFDFVFAHFDDVDNTGHAEGFSPAYQAAIQHLDTQIGQLLTALQQRQQDHPDEDWLVVVTPDHGRVAPVGGGHGGQTMSEKTTFIALNKPANAQFNAPFKDPANMSFNGIYGNAAQVDIVPTIMAYMGVKPNPDKYHIDGVPLIGALGVRQLTAQADNKARKVTLQWRNTETPSGKPLTIYRDGKEIAVLSDQVEQYVDSDFAEVADELVNINYSVALNEVPVAYLAQADFSKPVPLSPALLNGLEHVYLMENKLLDSRGGSAITPWVGAVTPVFGDDGLGGLALQSDALVSGYTMADTMLTTSTQFSVGFWFRSGGQQSDTPIFTNKDYASGKNPGIGIVQEGRSVRFNLSDGNLRVDIDGLNYSADTWVYMLLAVDGTNRSVQAYVGDPVKGLQQGSADLTGFDLKMLAGLKRFGLNEDALGTYFSRGHGNPGKMDFNDLALWHRVITKEEVAGLYSSGQSLASLHP